VPWSLQTGIYEVNIRQFTPEGTLKAFEAELPRIAQLGVGVLWLMPLQPIGVKNRKGSLGSSYSISDYTAVNPAFGTLDGVKRVVRQAHALGMKVILDWVANHTAWDHPWISQHPDWYRKNAQGEITGYTYEPAPGHVEVWDDVVGLDYGQRAVWPAMTQAMLFWLREADVDGFRCDVASLVPTPFWVQARQQLEAVKPVFMLAESDHPELHAQAFDATYDWRLYDTLKAIVQGKADAAALHAWWQQRQDRYPLDAIGLNFTGNHDTNAWSGSDAEFYGSLPAFQAMTVLAATLPGMPLVYGGQEAWFEKRLQFFEKDPIDWKGYRLADFYGRLLALKRSHPALAHGAAGGTLAFLKLGTDAVVAYTRRLADRQVTVIVNLSAQPQSVSPPAGPALTLAPWAWTLETT
jgi:glycosidase